MEVVPGRFDIAEGWNLIPNGIYFLRAGGKTNLSYFWWVLCPKMWPKKVSDMGLKLVPVAPGVC